MNNKDYFNFSQRHDDEIVDLSKPEGFLVISKNISEPQTALMNANHKLMDYITAYKVLKSSQIVDEKTINDIIDNIILLIETTDLINYSSFCVYLQVIGYSYSTYCSEKGNMSIDDKRELMKTLVDLYIKNRHEIYLSHGYSDQALQVQSDAASSRRKGKTGIGKMEDVLLPLGFKKAKIFEEQQIGDFESTIRFSFPAKMLKNIKELSTDSYVINR